MDTGGKTGRGVGRAGVGWGQAKEPASRCARVCQNYPLGKYSLDSPRNAIHYARSAGEVSRELPGKCREILGSAGSFEKLRGSLTPSQRHARIFSKEHALTEFLLLSIARVSRPAAKESDKRRSAKE